MQVHTTPVEVYNKSTWNASFTNREHLYSKATWPLVIAAASFVSIILSNLRLTQRDTAPTSSRHAVTLKGQRQKRTEIIDFTDSEKRQTTLWLPMRVLFHF